MNDPNAYAKGCPYSFSKELRINLIENARWLSFIHCKIQLPTGRLKIIEMNSYFVYEMLRKNYSRKQLKIYVIKLR